MSSFAIYEAVAKSRQGGGLLDEGGLLSPTDNRSFRRVFKDRDDVELYFY